jgi:hypothetical protein
MMAENMHVYDLDKPGLERIFSGTSEEIAEQLAAKANPNFIGDIAVLMDAGFKIVNKTDLNARLNSDRPYDRYSPDAIMVNTGSVANSPLKNAVVFLHAKGEQDTLHMHLAVDPSTPMEKISNISDNMIQKAPGEPFTGYMSLKRTREADGSLTPGNGLEDALYNVYDLKMNTVKIPFDDYGLGFMPFFAKAGDLTASKNDIEIAKGIIDNFREFNEVVDIPVYTLNQALKMHPDMHHLAVDLDEPEHEREISHGRRPRM